LPVPEQRASTLQEIAYTVPVALLKIFGNHRITHWTRISIPKVREKEGKRWEG
jgi:hypothetical protein